MMVSIPENFYVYLIHPLGVDSASKTPTKTENNDPSTPKEPEKIETPKPKNPIENGNSPPKVPPIPLKGSFSIPQFLANQEFLRQMMPHFPSIPSTSNARFPLFSPLNSQQQSISNYGFPMPFQPNRFPISENGHPISNYSPLPSNGYPQMISSPSISSSNWTPTLPSIPYPSISKDNQNVVIPPQVTTISSNPPVKAQMDQEERRKRLRSKLLETPVRKEIEAKKPFLLLVDKAEGPNGVNKRLEKLFPFGSGMAIVKLLDVIREEDSLNGEEIENQRKISPSTSPSSQSGVKCFRHPCESRKGFSLRDRKRMSNALQDFHNSKMARKEL